MGNGVTEIQFLLFLQLDSVCYGNATALLQQCYLVNPELKISQVSSEILMLITSCFISTYSYAKWSTKPN